MKRIILIIVSTTALSCTFFKNSEDHQKFIETKLSEMYNQKSIYQFIIEDLDHKNGETVKFTDSQIKPERRNNGTFLTKINLYQTYYEWERCNLPVPGRPGYVYSYQYGSRPKSILKQPIGQLEIRTAFDGESIYLINIDNTLKPDDIENKEKWGIIKELNISCR